MSKRKTTPEAFTAAKKFAVEVSGYDSTSPIWGKRLPDVLTGLEETIRIAVGDIEAGVYDVARDQLVSHALMTIEELKKRIAKQAIIASQTK